MDRPLLLNDILFGIVFGNQANSQILRALLNALLGLKGSERMTSLEIISPSPPKDHPRQKGVVLDVVARDGRQRVFDIEVQLYSEPAFPRRAFYYLARLAGMELERGDYYDELPKLIGVSLLNFVLFPKKAAMHSIYRLHDQASGHELSEVMEMHFIELEKFQSKERPAKKTPFERWLQVLKFAEFYNKNRAALPQEIAREEGVVMALDAMKNALSDEQVRVMIALQDKARKDEVNRLRYAEQQARKKALEEGREEGLRRGLAEGRQEGRQEGRREVIGTFLREKFGALTKKQRASLAKLDAEQLDALLPRAMKARSLAELDL